MTKTIFRYLFVVLALSCTLTSCSDDDDEQKASFFDQPTSFTEANGLCLKYSGDSLVGKQVVFTPSADKKSATLVVSGLPFVQPIGIDTLNLPTVGLIPGETTTTLNVNLTTTGETATFAGNETKENCTIEYNGSVKEGALKLNVNVKMNANPLQGKSFVAEKTVKGEANNFKPFHIVWVSDKAGFFDKMGDFLNTATTMPLFENKTKAATDMLCGVLNKVTFLEDGNIQALYKDEPADSLEWKTSPLNLATYTAETDTTIRLYLHPNQIASIVKVARTAKAADMDAIFKALMGMVNNICANGALLEYHLNENGAISVFLNEETLMPILQQVKPIFQDEEMIKMLLSMIKESAGPEMAPVVQMFLEPILKDLPRIIDTTTAINLGLELNAVK